MKFSISHIEVDFLIWTHFSNYLLFIVLLFLLICIGIIVFGLIKVNKSIWKGNKNLSNNKNNFQIINNAIEQREFLSFFPLFIKSRFNKKYGGLSNIRTDVFLRIMDLELKVANNNLLGILLIIIILFFIPLLDLLFQYLLSFGEGSDMNYLGIVSLKMFILSKYTVQRIILFISDGIMTGILIYLYKKYIHRIIHHLISLDLIIKNDIYVESKDEK